MSGLRVSAVIPTKNRPAELPLAVVSLLEQTHPPNELVIIDQSDDDRGRDAVQRLCAARGGGTVLRYLLDPSIGGLVHAKQVASGLADGDIVCFFEDDEVLEPDYLDEIVKGFEDRPDMLGCCGVVTNLPALPRGYATLFHVFHRGMFRDPRVGVHGRFERGRGPHALIPSPCLSGGLSCWRREVLESVPFDVANRLHMLEDIDYSTRAADRFGAKFFINPNARLEHRMSPVNREVLAPRQRRKLREYLIYYRKRADRPGASAHLAWLLVGLFLETIWQAARARDLAIMGAYFHGVRDGACWPLQAEAR